MIEPLSGRAGSTRFLTPPFGIRIREYCGWDNLEGVQCNTRCCGTKLKTKNAVFIGDSRASQSSYLPRMMCHFTGARNVPDDLPEGSTNGRRGL